MRFAQSWAFAHVMAVLLLGLTMDVVTKRFMVNTLDHIISF